MSAQEYSFYEGLVEGQGWTLTELRLLLADHMVLYTKTAVECCEAFEQGYLLGMCLTNKEVMKILRGY